MQRLAVKAGIPTPTQLIANNLLKAGGLCTCGRIMKPADPKFVMTALAPSMGQMVIAAYCFVCSSVINRTLHGLRKVIYTGTPTEPVQGKLSEA